MANKIPNLWPSETVSVETLSPLAILRTQAQNLTEMTQGLLEGEVTSIDEGPDTVIHQFEVVAPALNKYRHRILSVKHNKNLVYPVYFDTPKSLASIVSTVTKGGTTDKADTEAELIEELTGVFNSRIVLSVISSLIARINETRVETQFAAPKELQPA